jgi:serine/threonine protein kinase
MENQTYPLKLQDCEMAVSKGESAVVCKSCGNNIRLDLLVPDLTMSDAFSTDKRIDYNSIMILGEIGSGGFAKVYKGLYQEVEVAVKQLNIDEQQFEDQNMFSEKFSEFRREVWLMSNLSHPNTVKLIGICAKPLCMVLELCKLGDLYSWLEKQENVINEVVLEEREKMALDISMGMQFLHGTNPPIIHRDLRSPNILIAYCDSKGLICKIADFGLSRGLVWTSSLEGKVVDNPVWLAPEILRQEKYTEKVDVYAYGIICWELISGKHPFEQYQFVSDITEKVLAGDRPIVPDHTPEYYSILMNQCWSEKSEDRPSFKQITQRVTEKNAFAGGTANRSKFSVQAYFGDVETYRPSVPTGQGLQRANTAQPVKSIQPVHKSSLSISQTIGPSPSMVVESNYHSTGQLPSYQSPTQSKNNHQISNLSPIKSQSLITTKLFQKTNSVSNSISQVRVSDPSTISTTDVQHQHRSSTIDNVPSLSRQPCGTPAFGGPFRPSKHATPKKVDLSQGRSLKHSISIPAKLGSEITKSEERTTMEVTLPPLAEGRKSKNNPEKQ